MASSSPAVPAGSHGSTQVIRTGGLARVAIYVTLALFCLYYLLPLYVMVVNSLKPLARSRPAG